MSDANLSPSDLQSRIDALEAQLAAQTAAAAAAAAPAEPRAMPTVGELVSYSHDQTPSGGTTTRHGIVLAVDADRRHASVNWLPDAVADMAVDDLDP